MSYDARMWARRQVLQDSSAKHLLKTFADWAAEDYTVWVSVSELVADTELNAKTISKYVSVLVEKGYLRDTGLRQGRTRQIVVYQMTAPADAIVVQSLDRRTQQTKELGPPGVQEWDAKAIQKRNTSKNGGVKDNQERKSSKNGSLPNLDGKTPKFGAKDPQKQPESPPNLVDDRVYGLQEVLEGDACAREATTDDKTDHTHQTSETENPEPRAIWFERFWAAWPAASGRKQARDICESHWIANGLDVDGALIVAHVEAMKRTQHWKTGGDPTPIRYLEGRRWRDCSPQEIESATAAAPQTDVDSAWFATLEGVDERARQLKHRERKPDEDWRAFRVLVVKIAGDRRAAEAVLADAEKFNDSRLYQFARTTFGDALMPVDDYPS